MGRKSRRKIKPPGNQSGHAGKGARLDPARFVQANLETPVPGEHVMSRGSLDRSRLHPSLRDMPEDAEIRVIMVPGDGSDPPGHAGEYLGTLSEPYQSPEGDTVPAGYRVYRNLRPELAGDSGGFTQMDKRLRDTQIANFQSTMTAALDARQVPAAFRKPSAQAAQIMPRVIDGPRPDKTTVHLRPEDIRRHGVRLEAFSSGSDILPGWFEAREPEPPAILHLRAGDVLDAHSRLAEAMARPGESLLELFDTFVSDTLDQAGKAGGDWEKINRWAGMFWPAQTAKEWCGILTHQLRTARTYQVTPPMVSRVSEIYEGIQGRITHIRHADLPWPAGFAWLDKPAVLRDRWGKVIYNRAYSWDTVYIPFADGTKPGVRIISWSHPADRDTYWTEDVPEILEAHGGLGMGNSMVVPFGQRISVPRQPGQPVQDSAALWVRVLWNVLESVIATTKAAPRAEVGHGARRRAARRSLVHDEVNVVVLRRSLTLPAEGDGGHRNVHWTCRWPVDEFWRHARRDPAWEDEHAETGEDGRVLRHHAIPGADREHCAVCGSKISKIATYFKGPPGLPIRQRKQLYRLER